ncbi:hypothetical protein K503DRAFT_765033 [Rhizopogon vinicolor AM-OR11-026]|uniref:Homeobox domain-containing protein n=1 Tax=Rhizopogon vinicolor AM-OR11-026 TaxID=1314800 RepID=A0A1B7NHN5_9AGAM|nr:hypothetical protein K503DRAFT_765033 [Rhizopogon vinicolor AM-OR11-026]
MTIKASSSKKAKVVATRSQSGKSHRASLADVENAPRRECMTPEQLKILNPSYNKNPRPTPDDIASLAKKIQRPVQKVVNWFNNRRAKERRLHRHSSANPSPLSQSFSMNVDSDAGSTASEDDSDSFESEDNQNDPDCIAAMAGMSRKEVDVAFILCNLKRRIVHRQSQPSDVFTST